MTSSDAKIVYVNRKKYKTTIHADKTGVKVIVETAKKKGASK